MNRRRKRINWWLAVVASALVTLLATVFGRTGVFYELELKTYDQRFLLRGPKSVDHSEVAVVTIDDEDFTALDTRWPFPRSYYAHAIRNLLGAGAKLIIVDVQLFESSADSLEDIALANATREAGDRVIHAAEISLTERKQLRDVLVRPILPAKRIRAAGSPVGVVNQIPDRDGFTRQYPFAFRVDSLNWLPLAMKAYQMLQPHPDTIQLYRDDPDVVHFADLEIPRMTETTFLINYYGPAGTFPVHAFSSVLDDPSFELADGDTDYMQWFTMSDAEFEALASAMPEASVDVFRRLRAGNPFRDKVVFIGSAAAALQDTKKTPFYAWSPPGEVAAGNEEMPGVEVHAHAFQTLVDRAWLHNAPLLAEIAATFVLALLVFSLNSRLGLALAAPATLLIGLLYLAGAYYAFAEHHLWLAAVSPTGGLLMMFVFTTGYRFVLEQRDKAQIRGMFSRYVPKRVVDEIIEHPEMLQLGGERRRMTVLFTDVAGFTSISEQMSADDLVALLNEYLSEMSRIILGHEGIIDKYEGDLIMAEWGAPVYNEQHSTLACRAALRMQRKLAEMREQWRREGHPALDSRVGINTGEMLVGNMGCLEVFDYTVMGDAVNIASRLEGANKSYGTKIMIGQETRDEVGDAFATRPLDLIRVKGRAEPVDAYELLAESEDELPPALRETLPAYEAGMRAYRARDFAAAEREFSRVFERVPDDGPSRTYLERCRQFIVEPPPEDWDGVHALTEK